MTLGSCNTLLEQDESGTIRVENTRVSIDSLILSYYEGATAEEIVERYPSISLSAVYAAIAFYLQNQIELDEYVKRRQTELQHLKGLLESRTNLHGFRQRLLARKPA
jgi:uncharacterized protein (DUF433 family)